MRMLKGVIFGIGAGLFSMVLPVSVGARELIREETEIEVDHGEEDNIAYIPAEGTVNGYPYKRNPEDGYWIGKWSRALSVTKVITRYYREGDGEAAETERIEIPCYDDRIIDMTTLRYVFPEDYYLIKGATTHEYGSNRAMRYNPDPKELTELTVIYEDEEYSIPYVPVKADITGYEASIYSLMLKDMEDAEFYVFVGGDSYFPIEDEAFENIDFGIRQFFMLNYFAGGNADSGPAGFYGLRAGTRFDSSTLKPAIEGELLCKLRNDPGTGVLSVAAVIYPDWEIDFDEIGEGYELLASDNYRSFSGKLVKEDGSEHEFSVLVGVKAPELYASFVVSIPAAIELSEGVNGFSGAMGLGVAISSNNEDFYVSVVPEDLEVIGELTGDVFPISAASERTVFRISDQSMEESEDVFSDSGEIRLFSEGLPRRADTYVGVLTIRISSGTQ